MLYLSNNVAIKQTKMHKKEALGDIMGSRAKIALLRFLSLEKDWQFNLSSIARKISLDKGALSRLIKELESLDVIEVKREGKLLLFRINQKNMIMTSLIIPFFEKEGRLA